MKKLFKRNNMDENTIEAYACYCGCNCGLGCSCSPGDYDQKYDYRDYYNTYKQQDYGSSKQSVIG